MMPCKSVNGKCQINTILWVFLIALLGLSALLNLISIIVYLRIISLSLFGAGLVLVVIKCFLKKSIQSNSSKLRKSFSSEITLFCLFGLLFLSNGIIPRLRIVYIANKADLHFPITSKVHIFYQDLSGFTGTEDDFIVKISFPKKHIIPFTKPFWIEEDSLNKIVFDENRDGLPITIFPNSITPQTFVLFNNADPNEIFKMRGQVHEDFQHSSYDHDEKIRCHYFDWQLGYWRFDTRRKHWATKRAGRGHYVKLFLDIEGERTATAYMDITIY